MPQSAPKSKSIILWLLILIAMIYGIVIVGGLTRLTGSGLSMVDWQPIMGVLPPLSEEQWMQTFEQYRQFPEYQQINQGMSLAEFKRIFYWEYGHRMLARFLGLAFLIPFLIFWIKGQIQGVWLIKFGIAFVLGGLQGVLGWYMVMSGLVDVPHVSHYRLAAHLGLALVIMGYLLWLMLDLLPKLEIRLKGSARSLRSLALTVLVLICLQILYGAFTAGLNAGLIYNTFPDWNGRWLPVGIGQISPWFLNLLENPVTVQLVHRTLGWLLLGVTALNLIMTLQHAKSKALRSAAGFLFASLLIQFGLGVATLLLRVPLTLASLHQAMAVVVLMISIWNVYLLFAKGQEAAVSSTVAVRTRKQA